jgi:hypothetical protein
MQITLSTTYTYHQRHINRGTYCGPKCRLRDAHLVPDTRVLQAYV